MEVINYPIEARILSMRQVIKNLRISDLRNGHCFMIFDDDLPDKQAYYEYPDGNIHIEQIDENNIDIPRLLIKVLDKNEIAGVKEKHEVFHEP